MEQKKQPKLFTWRQGVLMVMAVAGGLGLNAYRTYRTQGAIDTRWYVIAAITLAIMGIIFFFVARQANKSERDD
jgi:dipeptide/tripeptide permease